VNRRVSDIPLALAMSALAACAGRVEPTNGYCAPPDPELCSTEGDSAFWGPGPHVYCAEGDGSEWHVDEVMSTRYLKEPGTYHSPRTTLCEVAPDGRVLFEGPRRSTTTVVLP